MINRFTCVSIVSATYDLFFSPFVQTLPDILTAESSLGHLVALVSGLFAFARGPWTFLVKVYQKPVRGWELLLTQDFVCIYSATICPIMIVTFFSVSAKNRKLLIWINESQTIALLKKLQYSHHPQRPHDSTRINLSEFPKCWFFF